MGLHEPTPPLWMAFLFSLMLLLSSLSDTYIHILYMHNFYSHLRARLLIPGPLSFINIAVIHVIGNHFFSVE